MSLSQHATYLFINSLTPHIISEKMKRLFILISFCQKHNKSIDLNATLHPDITIEVYLFIDSQRCNRVDSDYVIGHLSQDFSVSKEVVRIRMQNLGLLEYGSDTPKRVREIIW